MSYFRERIGDKIGHSEKKIIRYFVRNLKLMQTLYLECESKSRDTNGKIQMGGIITNASIHVEQGSNDVKHARYIPYAIEESSCGSRLYGLEIIMDENNQTIIPANFSIDSNPLKNHFILSPGAEIFGYYKINIKIVERNSKGIITALKQYVKQHEENGDFNTQMTMDIISIIINYQKLNNVYKLYLCSYVKGELYGKIPWGRDVRTAVVYC